MNNIKYSWILPIKNEALSLPILLSEIQIVMKKSTFEIIAVDDASTDSTLKTLNSLKSNLPQLKIIHFKSHIGKWAALTAGFRETRGSTVISLDSDLQDDPSQINKLLKKITLGYDLVSGQRKTRHDPLYKVYLSGLGNKLASILSHSQFYDLNSPFKVYKQACLENLPDSGSLMRFSMLFAQKLGYRVCEVEIVHRPRLYGRSKFGVVKYLRILYDLSLIWLLFSGSGGLKKLKIEPPEQLKK